MCVGLRYYRKNISQAVCCKKKKKKKKRKKKEKKRVDLGRMCDISCQSITFSLIVASSRRYRKPSRVRLWFPCLLLHNSLHAAEIYDAPRLAALRCVKTDAHKEEQDRKTLRLKIKA